MSSPDQRERPWETLLVFIEQEDVGSVHEFLDSLSGSEVGRAVSRLNERERGRLMRLLAPEDAAEVVESLPEIQAADMIAHLEPSQSAAIFEQLPSDERADLLGDLTQENAEAILSEMGVEEARDARILSGYARDVAGGLMTTEHLVFPENFSVSQVLSTLRDSAEKYRNSCCP